MIVGAMAGGFAATLSLCAFAETMPVSAIENSPPILAADAFTPNHDISGRDGSSQDAHVTTEEDVLPALRQHSVGSCYAPLRHHVVMHRRAASSAVASASVRAKPYQPIVAQATPAPSHALQASASTCQGAYGGTMLCPNYVLLGVGY
jgi:hypothetical protein